MNRILFVEDDLNYQFVIQELLDLEGYEVDTATNAADALSLFKENNYDILITDYSIGEVDGLQLTQLLRRIEPGLKVIVLTGQNDDEVELKGLNLAIQDYIKKPVNFQILLKRLELALSTKPLDKKTELLSRENKIHVDLNRRIVKQDGEHVELTATEYNLLVYFLEHKNIVKSRDEILADVWKSQKYIESRSVDTHVKNLRSKLDLSCIFSIRGVGYEWVEQ